jgi:hypothetical protein
MRIYLPHTQQSIKAILEISKGNISKFNKFTSTIVNPASLANLVIELNAVKAADVQTT